MNDRRFFEASECGHQMSPEMLSDIVASHIKNRDAGWHFPERERRVRLIFRLAEFNWLKRKAVEREDFAAAAEYRDECNRLIEKLRRRGMVFPEIVIADGKIVWDGEEMPEPDHIDE